MGGMCSRSDKDAFADPYQALLQEFDCQIGERQESYGRAGSSIREEIVRCVWFGGHFPSRGLKTDDGRRLEIVSPGWWNVEGGPDFARAEFLLEGQGRVVGDVEIHTRASDWYAHGHHLQPEYNEVALHVVMWADRDETAVRTAAGSQIPQFTLSTAVEEDIEDLVDVIEPEADTAGPAWPVPDGRYCARAYEDGLIDPEWMGRLLDAAGDHRLIRRADEAADLLRNHPPDQILYERIAEALGYKNNRVPFLQLAGMLPLSALRRAVPPQADVAERLVLLDAALFSTAGLLDGASSADVDGDTVAYLERLAEARERLAEALTRTKLAADQWRLSGSRPANNPARRMAALSALCAQYLHTGLFRHFLRVAQTTRPKPHRSHGVAVRSALVNCFRELAHPYWSRRYTLGGKVLAAPRALVGAGRATSMLVDVLLPLMLAHARLEGDGGLQDVLRAVWNGLPRRQENSVTRRMKLVMFPNAEESDRVVNSARRQQGLHQLHRDFCRTDVECQRCVVYLAHKAGRQMSPV